MPVYVDACELPFGRMLMCHMLADTRDELDAMADRIGVQRKWIQFPGTYREHYDIAKAKRVLAVAAGAHEVETDFLVALRARKREALAREPKE